jgi:hypothetical protein
VAFQGRDSGGPQTNPLMIGRRMFVYTSTQQVVALDGATGERLWVFDSGTPGLQPARGFSYWSDGGHGIMFAAQRSYVYALDPETGKPLTSFGEGGRIDLRKDLGATETENSFAAVTTPGVIYKDMIILGFRLPETKPALHSDIRAYDVHTGKLRWSFHTIPHPGEAGYESWPADAWKQTGAANNWTGMSVDVKRGIVYAPTGSVVDDFYGGDRIGDDHFADTLLALDAATGRRQTVVFPGFDGGAEWGGSAVDVRTGVIYINANDIPWTGGLTEAKAGGGPGAAIFRENCAMCHGMDRSGFPPMFPSLVDVSQRLTDAEITATVQNGMGDACPRSPLCAGTDGFAAEVSDCR